ncbi:MAG: DUF2062 domain-containing protein, partial [Burkholderiales bacterium]|nr:DUF2062 domain-containing protein [Phycisphaerae bacterium]
LLAAKRLRLNPLAVLAGSHLSTPPIGAFLIALAILVGHLLQNGTWLRLSDIDPNRVGYMNLLRQGASDLIIGSVVCGGVFAVLTFFTLQAILHLIPTVRGTEPPVDPTAAPARSG